MILGLGSVGRSLLKILLKDESPTVYPVAASLFAAIRYIMNHPAEGILFPEFTGPEEIISYVSKLLPVVITRL